MSKFAIFLLLLTLEAISSQKMTSKIFLGLTKFGLETKMAVRELVGMLW